MTEKELDQFIDLTIQANLFSPHATSRAVDLWRATIIHNGGAAKLEAAIKNAENRRKTL